MFTSFHIFNFTIVCDIMNKSPLILFPPENIQKTRNNQMVSRCSCKVNNVVQNKAICLKLTIVCVVIT